MYLNEPGLNHEKVDPLTNSQNRLNQNHPSHQALVHKVKRADTGIQVVTLVRVPRQKKVLSVEESEPGKQFTKAATDPPMFLVGRTSNGSQDLLHSIDCQLFQERRKKDTQHGLKSSENSLNRCP